MRVNNDKAILAHDLAQLRPPGLCSAKNYKFKHLFPAMTDQKQFGGRLSENASKIQKVPSQFVFLHFTKKDQFLKWM